VIADDNNTSPNFATEGQRLLILLV